MTSASTARAQLRITKLATLLPVHRAFQWLHLHQPQLKLWHAEMLQIPAPPFGERPRALWFLDRFRELGLSQVQLDAEGNAIGELPASVEVGDAEESRKVLLLSAHLDTVFPAGTETTPREEETRVYAPGACDNGAGLSGLLAIVAAFQHAQIALPITLVFCANVGEEGAGDLRGMRHLFTDGNYAGRIRAAIALEGAGTATAVTRALGSRRFRFTMSGPGGHSWTDARTPNPITLISRGIAQLSELALPAGGGSEARTTLSPGQISGGTSINSIPESAIVEFDLRSTAPDQIKHYGAIIEQTFAAIVDGANRGHGAEIVQVKCQVIGDRPAAVLDEHSAFLDTLRAVDRHLGLRTEFQIGSTDANLPLSLGIPAAALAAGGTGGGIHTLGEWYDASGRETALRRILLTILDLAQTI